MSLLTTLANTLMRRPNLALPPSIPNEKHFGSPKMPWLRPVRARRRLGSGVELIMSEMGQTRPCGGVRRSPIILRKPTSKWTFQIGRFVPKPAVSNRSK